MDPFDAKRRWITRRRRPSHAREVDLSMGGGAGVAAASVVLLAHVDLLARVPVFSKTCPGPAGAGTVVVTVHVGALVLYIKGLRLRYL